jgi:hypothetical protein
MKPEDQDARDAELRRLLVATSDLVPLMRPRPSRRVVAVLAVGCVLAGSLTGGAIAVAAQTGTPSGATNYELSEAAQTLTTSSVGTLLGTPIAETATGDLEVPLTAAPARANNLVIGFECQDPGTYTVKLDSKVVAREKCGPVAPLSGIGNGDVVYPDAGRPGVVQRVTLFVGAPSAVLIPTSPDAVALTIAGPNDRRFAVWVSSVRIPPLTPTAAEQAELADGVVTRDEYEAAMNRFFGCLTAKGFSVSDVDLKGPMIGFVFDSSNPAAAGASTVCFDTEAEGVHAKWIEEDEGKKLRSR